MLEYTDSVNKKSVIAMQCRLYINMYTRRGKTVFNFHILKSFLSSALSCSEFRYNKLSNNHGILVFIPNPE